MTKGDVGDRRRVVLPPPSRGWCRGRHRVTVLLETGPYCPPPDPGGQPAPCPKFATQVVDAGHARFRVRRR